MWFDDGTGSIEYFPDTNIELADSPPQSHIVVDSTIPVAAANQFYIEAQTASGIKLKKNIFIRVCGDEIISLVDNLDKKYDYDKDIGTQTVIDVATYFSLGPD